ncbi:MAG: Retroviral aspartyl protease, partial [Dehalococcoidia bacterium]|nr:Retroviral aspartyl protease [Dehalococcoidia bacterium]
ADGREASYPIAQVRVRLDGRERFTICVFGEEGTEPLLGAVTLEEFGLAVDPLNKRLIPVRGYLLRGTD